MSKVTLLAADWCPISIKTVEFWKELSKSGVFEYEEVDISSPIGRQLAKTHSIESVPVTFIDGKIAFHGLPTRNDAERRINEIQDKGIKETIYDLDIEMTEMKREERKVINDLEMIVKLFKRRLLNKKGNRESLEKRISDSIQDRFDTFEELKRVTRNLEIYEGDIKTIKTRLEKMKGIDIWLKERYNEILSGNLVNLTFDLEEDKDESLSHILHNMFETYRKFQITLKGSGDGLEKRKDHFLSGLDKLLGELDSKLLYIENEKNGLQKRDLDIRQKIENDKRQHSILQNKYALLVEDIKKMKAEIEASIKVEKNLIQEYRKILSRMTSALELPQGVDTLLFSSISEIDGDFRDPQIDPQIKSEMDVTQTGGDRDEKIYVWMKGEGQGQG
ncbi:MAG: hypothetical protein HY999_00530 [Nitrospinae bacterium]|nr:hypothetical protein [Nitrospinota bacterium]